MSNLQRHHQMAGHKVAVYAFLGLPAAGCDEYQGSPSLEDFTTVFDKITTGTAPSAGVPGIGTRKKIIKMVFCLAEALAQQDRAFIRQACMSSHRRDESNGRLAIRCSASTPALATRLFHQSTQRNFGTGATCITDATEKAWKEFATIIFGCPQIKYGAIKYDGDLFDHMRNIHHQLIIDSASDERLSARQMEEVVTYMFYILHSRS